jgi:group I intron endonuclease
MNYLYKITNLVNNKIYIGQTAKPSKRWSDHKSEAKRGHKKYPLYLSIRKHGEDNFKFEIIAECKSLNDCNLTEIELVKQYNSLAPNGYNLLPGGDCNPAIKGRKLSAEHKAKIVGTGRKHTEETKIKMSKSHIGINKGKISKKRIFTLDIEKEICDKYKIVNSYRILAREYDTNHVTISNIIKRGL